MKYNETERQTEPADETKKRQEENTDKDIPAKVPGKAERKENKNRGG